ncbi:MAG: peptidoglycan-binding protein [Candidatus Nomurabacteria bacterium]|nr:peptidoglycan-binding protein [Candidatus Nomurabacteria bacterium]
MEATAKMLNIFSKYKILFLVVFLFLFSNLSPAFAVNYGAGLHGAGLYGATFPSAPTSSPTAGIYNTTQSITLSASNSTSIRYSTSGTPANCSSGTLYSVPISISYSQTIYALACDSYNNSISANFIYQIDTNSPVISAIAVDSTSTVTWTTDKLASSIVDYGLTGSYGTSTTETNTSPRVLSHSVTLPSLTSCTTYHYRIRSKDSASNEGVSPDQTFISNGCVDIVVPVTPPVSTSHSVGTTLAFRNKFLADQKALVSQNATTPSVVSSNLNISRSLKLNKSGSDVKELQKYLNAKGYTVASQGAGSPGKENTFFGSATKKAVIRFQKANKLTPDGIIGPATIKKMK